MEEIEINVELFSTLEEAKNKLSQFNFIGEEKIMDVYFYDPNKVSSKPNKEKEIGESLRLRNINGKFKVSYKIDKYDETGKWLYSDNIEKEITNVNETLKQFNQSGLKEMFTIKNIRNHYKNVEFDIYVENVENLGNFIEIEKHVLETEDIIKLKENMYSFVINLGLNISEALKIGKPEMMLKALNIDIK
ncbi:MAG: class IV adenylate cyclase [Bacilli bacterium]